MLDPFRGGIAGPNRLGGIFNHRHRIALTDRLNFVHRTAETEEMDRDDCSDSKPVPRPDDPSHRRCTAWQKNSSNFSGDKLKVSGSISTNTGFAPIRAIQPAVEKKVNGVVTTASPGPIPKAIRIKSSASVPDETPTAWPPPHSEAIAFSSCSTLDPRMKCLSIADRGNLA